MRPPEEIETGEVPLDLSDLDEDEKGPRGVKIELQDVHFKYPTRDVPVLNGLNMTVGPLFALYNENYGYLNTNLIYTD
jgi:ATP-binding cassette subfamily B (MDR/TAP) protein 1